MCIFMGVRVREKRRRCPCGGMVADSEGCTRSWQNLICDEVYTSQMYRAEPVCEKDRRGVGEEEEGRICCVL